MKVLLLLVFVQFLSYASTQSNITVFADPASQHVAPDCGEEGRACSTIQDAMCVALCSSNPNTIVNKTIIYLADGVYTGEKNIATRISGVCGDCPVGNGPYFVSTQDFSIINGAPGKNNTGPRANISCAYQSGGFRSDWNPGFPGTFEVTGLIFDKCRRSSYDAVLQVFSLNTTLVIRNCQFTRNLAKPVFFWNGGVVDIINTEFSYNTGLGTYLDGSGVEIQASNQDPSHGVSVNIEHCNFTGNTNFNTHSNGNCGAAFYFQAYTNPGTLHIRHTLFDKNSANSGGALCLWNVTTDVSDTHFSNNGATNNGGAVSLHSGAYAVLCNNVTYDSNTANAGNLFELWDSTAICDASQFGARDLKVDDNSQVFDCEGRHVPAISPPSSSSSYAIGWQIFAAILLLGFIAFSFILLFVYFRKRSQYAQVAKPTQNYQL